MAEKPKITKEETTFDLDLKIQKTDEKEVIFRIRIPYNGIWLEEKEGIWEATLSLSLQIFDSSGDRIWEKETDYPISIADENLDEIRGKAYLIQVPASVEPGEYSVTIELENKADKNRISRKAKFKI
jgi:hypothetical protein